jgi:hypothetical protein
MAQGRRAILHIMGLTRIAKVGPDRSEGTVSEPGAWDFGWTAVGALAAAGAIVVALFLPILTHFLLQPRLDIAFEDRAPYRRDGKADPGGRWTDEIWFRGKVRNKGRSAARSVRVQAISVNGPAQWRGAVGSEFDPVVLSWSGRSDGAPEILVRSEAKLVDLIKLQQWHGPEGHMELVTNETLAKAQPNDYLGGTYEIQLVILADNARPVSRRLAVSLQNVIRESTVRLV